MNSKKAQSEIITTVLIILLVLAAIIIVWQVVQTTIGTTKVGIDHNKMCLGSQLAIVKATAGSGTCPYPNVDAMNICPEIKKLVVLTGGFCPIASPDIVKCLDGPIDTYPTPSVPGQIIVTREAASGNDENVTAKVYINDVQNSAISDPLAVHGRVTISVINLSVGNEVKVAPMLSDNYLCSAAQSVKVTAP